MGNHDHRAFHPADGDIAVLAIILAPIDPGHDGSIEDAFGGFEVDPMLADVGLVLGPVPFKCYRSAVPLSCSYNRAAKKNPSAAPSELQARIKVVAKPHSMTAAVLLAMKSAVALKGALQ